MSSLIRITSYNVCYTKLLRYLQRIESLRNDEAQSASRARLQEEGAVVGLHNDAS